MFEPLGTGGLSRSEPDGVYGVDVLGQSRCDHNICDGGNDEFVVAVHHRRNSVVRLFGAEGRVKVKD